MYGNIFSCWNLNHEFQVFVLFLLSYLQKCRKQFNSKIKDSSMQIRVQTS